MGRRFSIRERKELWRHPANILILQIKKQKRKVAKRRTGKERRRQRSRESYPSPHEPPATSKRVPATMAQLIHPATTNENLLCARTALGWDTHINKTQDLCPTELMTKWSESDIKK